ncbi:hypothetical protein GGR56DRAFT_655604 [Xylariaceae sp. FL0804]|nr:hypothetical protein GGR56DRAFT_655604 [Xylariaceae sp. FL0804]
MSTSPKDIFMRDPPPGVERFAASSQASTMIIIGVVVFGLATLVYGLRIWTRVKVTKTKLRVDDLLAGIAVVLGWSFFSTVVAMSMVGGCGKDFWQVTESEYENLLKWTVPSATTYTLSSVFSKLSLLFFYRHLSPKRPFRIIVTTLIGLIVIYAVTWTCLNIFGCRPLKAAWDIKAMATGRCIDKGTFYLSASVANVCIDGIILLIPIQIIVPLRMSRRQKASLVLLFATGGFVIIAASINITLTEKLFRSSNYTWDLGTEMCWVNAEVASSAICASAGLLKPFFVRYLPSLISSRFGSDGSSGSGRGGYGHHGSSSAGGGGVRSHTHSHSHRKGGGGGIRGCAAEAYELESGDEDESDSSKRGGGAPHHIDDDEEAKLWTGGRGDAPCREVVISAATAGTGAGTGTAGSDSSDEGGTTGRTRSFSLPVQQNAPPGPGKTMGGGINVTSELSISYAKPGEAR